MKKINEGEISGNILEVFEKSKLKPTTKDPKMIGEIISIILEDEKLKYAFAKACSESKKSGRVIARIAIKTWLTDNGYL